MKSFSQIRKVLIEESSEISIQEKAVSIDTSDYKISPTSGRKVRAHRFKVGEKDAADFLANSANASVETANTSTVQENVEVNPPTLLVLKRKFIRQMPSQAGGPPIRVAVYYNDKLGRYFSIPYQPLAAGRTMAPDNQMITAEESDEQVNESVMDTLHRIVNEKQANKVKFGNGKTMKVDHFTASAITQVHSALNDENKKKFANMVHKSPEHLHKAAEFAFKHAK